MRFAILTNAFPPDGRGGAERTAFMQADALACLGHEVRVWAPDKGAGSRGSHPGEEHAHGKKAERTIVHGMEVMRFASVFGSLARMSKMERLDFHLSTDAGARQDIAKDIVAWKPDVLLTHNLTGCGFGTPRTIQKKGVKWIHTLHDIQLTDPSGGESLAWSKTTKARLWRRFWSWRRQVEFGVPDVLVSPTKWLMAWHTRAGFKGQHHAVIPNPIEMLPARERRLNHPATIVYVGRLSKDKGFDIFLKALDRIPDVYVNKALVVGGGTMMATAERGRDHRLMLRGALSFDDARRAIADADLLIAPSQILENQQTILLEAMAEGTPAIATDVGGTRETLEVTGCPVIPINSQQDRDIADAAIGILSDAEEWTRLSAAMRKQAEDVHAAEKYFDALVKLF